MKKAENKWTTDKFRKKLEEEIFKAKPNPGEFEKLTSKLTGLKEELLRKPFLNLCDMYCEGNGPTMAFYHSLDKGYNIPMANMKDTNDLTNRGLYVLYYKNKPFYTGIGKNIFKRLNQHAKSKKFGSSAILLKLAKFHHDWSEIGTNFKKEDENIYKSSGIPANKWLYEQKLRFVLVNSWELLYMFELYIAMELGTAFNSFETH